MKFLLNSILLLVPILGFGQFVFQGRVSPDFKDSEISLSLVEDYRKSSRNYEDQVISRSLTDSLGNFLFSGNNLPEKNALYLLHVDKCHQEGLRSHFLEECPQSESILFIANNRDTLQLPLASNQQGFCNVQSTNPASSYLLEVAALKEEMILDFSGADTPAAQNLLMEKWFQKLQSFGLETSEPLVEVIIYDFLSDRKNETREYYLSDLQSSDYYRDLNNRLKISYPHSPITRQYQNELKGDLMDADLAIQKDASGFPIKTLLPLGAALVVSGILLFFLLKKRRKTSGLSALSPQEKNILQAILDGKTNKEISEGLFISLSTVKTHINSIYKKLGIQSRAQIISRFKGNSTGV